MAADPVKVPPQSLEAESSVLGGVLLDPVSIHRAMEILAPEDFYRPAHAVIYRALIALAERGQQCDLLLLQEELDRSGKLAEVGGTAYLSSLVDSLPSASNLPHYAKIVKEKSILRRLMRVSQEVSERIMSSSDTPEAILDWAEKQIFSVTSMHFGTDFHELKELLKLAMKEVDSRCKKGTATEISTGFRDLDELTAGFQRGDLIIVAARPSMGKTALALNIAQHVAVEEKVPVAIFSLEMSKVQLALRMLATEARVPSDRIRKGRLHKRDFADLITACDRLANAPIVIDDSASLNVLEIRAKSRRLKSEGRLGLVIVDYLQLIRGVGRTENRQQEISDISRSLKAMAKELDVPVLAVSQLSRAVELRKPPRPILADLRESGAIEQDGDLILFIYREELYERENEQCKGKAELIIGKQRNGPIGSVDVSFQDEFTRFNDLAGGRAHPVPAQGDRAPGGEVE